jgi:serine/threonine-protein kinase
VRSASVVGLAEQAAHRFRDPALVSVGLADPPRAPLADGAAGVAYFLWRHAGFGGGEASLEAAERWAAQAERACSRPGGFAREARSLSRSLHYRDPGVWWVRALVAAAVGNEGQVRRWAARFAETAARSSGAPWDVNWGSAGLLLGCAQLVESVEAAAAGAAVRAAGERLASELTRLAEREGAMPGETALGYLGAAHGWAGVAQSLLRWSRAVCQPPSPQVLALLERLIALRRPSGRWPVRAGSREVWRGWCHGSAGWAQLWALAWQVTGDERLLGLAAQSAVDAVAADESNASLCCGRAGQGYAALTLYQATGERRWLGAAHRVATEAARRSEADGAPAHSLLTGELGVALLMAELEDPARAAMPVYQSIGSA